MQTDSNLTLSATEPGWPRVVISDLHLGSSHVRADDLTAFLKGLPDTALLILNGDTIDAPGQDLPAKHQAILGILAELAQQDRLIWIFGNHDDGYIPIEPGKWPPTTHCELEGRLLITHGDAFDNVMPRYRWFLNLFKSLHKLRMKLGARPVHVARYAKYFKPLYSFLCHAVQENAIEYALEVDLPAITCGHVHLVADHRASGIRYINTGCWTEEHQAHCIMVTPDTIELVNLDTRPQGDKWPD